MATPRAGTGVTAQFVESGAIISGSIGSGSVQGFFSSGRNIASGTVGVSDFGSGAVQSGQMASGSVTGFGTSGVSTTARNIASGSIGGFDLGNAVLLSGHMAAAFIDASKMASGSVRSGNIASGQIGHFHISSGGVEGTGLSGIPSNIASGSIGTNDIATSTLLHHQLAVGPVAPYTGTMAWGVAVGPQGIIAGQGQMSGGAVAMTTPTTATGYPVVPAERNSGLRLPCIGVMASGAASGQNAVVVTQGFVARDFFMASGYTNQPLYVGSGGFIVTQSGGLGATFSGAGGGASGFGAVQRIGFCVSGGMFVNIDMNITSGLNSTPVGTF